MFLPPRRVRRARASLQAALSSDGVLEGVLLEDVEDSYTCEVEDFFSDAEDSLGIGGRRRCRCAHGGSIGGGGIVNDAIIRRGCYWGTCGSSGCILSSSILSCGGRSGGGASYGENQVAGCSESL